MNEIKKSRKKIFKKLLTLKLETSKYQEQYLCLCRGILNCRYVFHILLITVLSHEVMNDVFCKESLF